MTCISHILVTRANRALQARGFCPPCVRPLLAAKARRRGLLSCEMWRCGGVNRAHLEWTNEEWEPANFVRASFSLSKSWNIFCLFFYSSYHLIFWSKTHLVLAAQENDLI